MIHKRGHARGMIKEEAKKESSVAFQQLKRTKLVDLMKSHCTRCQTCKATNQYGYTNDPDKDNYKVKLFESESDFSKPNETRCSTGSRMNSEMDVIFTDLKKAKSL